MHRPQKGKRRQTVKPDAALEKTREQGVSSALSEPLQPAKLFCWQKCCYLTAWPRLSQETPTMEPTTGLILRRITQTELSVSAHKLATIILDGIAWKEG